MFFNHEQTHPEDGGDVFLENAVDQKSLPLR